MAERLAGRLTAWNTQTTYAQTKRALQLAQCIFAQGEAERRALIEGFRVPPQRILLLPNGISPHFFAADEALFRRKTEIAGPFVLMVGAISPYKNQLGLVQALSGSGLPIVLIGKAQNQHQPYLEQLRSQPNVTCLGQLDHHDPLLASAYRAAAVLALPSQGEVFPLSVLEALAAGTPVVMTDDSALRLEGSQFALKQLRWDDQAAIADAVSALLRSPPARTEVQALVARFTWQRVAQELANCYRWILKVADFPQNPAHG
jgi:glycosyltransferase involved in cell wall biosynthesis